MTERGGFTWMRDTRPDPGAEGRVPEVAVGASPMRLRSHLVALVLAALVPVLGFAAHVVKPVNPDALLATIHTAGHTAAPGDA